MIKESNSTISLKTRILSIMLILAMCFLIPSHSKVSVSAAGSNEIHTYSSELADKVSLAKKSALDYILRTVDNPTVASVGGEWAVFALARGNIDNKSFYSKYYSNVCEIVKANGKAAFNENKGTENSRVVIALTSIGADPKSVAGFDLTEPLKDYEYVIKQGLSGAVFGLIALNAGEFGAEDVKEKLVSYILEKKISEGGWAFAGAKPDPDMTGMVLMALAPYYETDANVKQAADAALGIDFDLKYSESAAQLVCAYAAFNMEDKVSKSMDILLNYQMEDSGGFCHEAGKSVNLMASEQAAYALVAADRMLSGENALYDIKKDKIKTKYSGSPEEITFPQNQIENVTDSSIKQSDTKNDLSVKQDSNSLNIKADQAKTDKDIKSFTAKNIRYSVIQSDTVSVKGLNKLKNNISALKIPATVSFNEKTYKVVKIAAGAFKGNKKIKKVTLGRYVEEIGKAAFMNCRKLKKVIIKAKKLKKIGNKAFKGTNVILK